VVLGVFVWLGAAAVKGFQPEPASATT
jgi:hypothetical protein